MKQLLSLFLILILSLFAWSQSTSTDRNKPIKQTIIVGTNAEYPPYAYIDAGEIVGFDIEIAEEICKRLDIEMTMEDMPFEALIPSLVLKRIDFVAAGLTPTEERAKRVLFTNSYTTGDPLMIMSRADQAIASKQELLGKRVIVNDGYTADSYCSQIKGIEIIRLPAPADALLALRSGRGDAFITVYSTAQRLAEGQQKGFYHLTPLKTDADGCSLAFHKEHSALQQSVQEQLDQMEVDGTLSLLKKKWGLS